MPFNVGPWELLLILLGLLLVFGEEVPDDQEALFFVRSELGVGDMHENFCVFKKPLLLVGVDLNDAFEQG